MPGFHAIWFGLGAAMIIPFAILGAAIRPIWIPLGFAIVGSAIWIWGLGWWGFLAGAVGGVIGVLLGIPLRRGLFAFRERRIAQRTHASDGGPS